LVSIRPQAAYSSGGYQQHETSVKTPVEEGPVVDEKESG